MTEWSCSIIPSWKTAHQILTPTIEKQRQTYTKLQQEVCQINTDWDQIIRYKVIIQDVSKPYNFLLALLHQLLGRGQFPARLFF